MILSLWRQTQSCKGPVGRMGTSTAMRVSICDAYVSHMRIIWLLRKGHTGWSRVTHSLDCVCACECVWGEETQQRFDQLFGSTCVVYRGKRLCGKMTFWVLLCLHIHVVTHFSAKCCNYCVCLWMTLLTSLGLFIKAVDGVKMCRFLLERNPNRHTIRGKKPASAH